MPDSERTVELHNAIDEHLRLFGSEGWSRVREGFPDISTATFWRHVRLVRDRRETKPYSADAIQSAVHSLLSTH